MQLKMDENMSTSEAPPPLKKKRSLPGHPDPNSKVIAMSPKSLIERNRFVCEICKKGFQRDQNLQLHRRGHNLPWKLKKRRDDDDEMIIMKKVYVCPEKTCVHNNPSRALGDLTGIKKHFFRKHGEKKWKCEKCSKCYAVHSDWKAHSKICGTREYTCDCGTLFSRRDSFMTHRAFCDALAEESSTSTTSSHSSSSAHITLNPQLDQIHRNFFFNNNINPTLEQYHHHHHHINYLNLPWLLHPPTPPLFGPNQQFENHKSADLTVLLPMPDYPQYSTIANSADHMSAADQLLQKAAEMGLNINKASQSTTASSGIMIRPHHTHMSGLGLYSSRDQEIENKAASSCSDDDIILLQEYQHMMNINARLGGAPPCSSSMMSALSSSNGFDDDEFHGFLLNLQTRRPYSNINNAVDQNSIEESQFTKSS